MIVAWWRGRAPLWQPFWIGGPLSLGSAGLIAWFNNEAFFFCLEGAADVGLKLAQFGLAAIWLAFSVFYFVSVGRCIRLGGWGVAAKTVSGLVVFVGLFIIAMSLLGKSLDPCGMELLPTRSDS